MERKADGTHKHQLEFYEEKLKPMPILVTSDIGNKGVLKKLGSVTDLNMHTWLRGQRCGRMNQGKVEQLQA